jgi:hypothetical protein
VELIEFCEGGDQMTAWVTPEIRHTEFTAAMMPPVCACSCSGGAGAGSGR